MKPQRSCSRPFFASETANERIESSTNFIPSLRTQRRQDGRAASQGSVHSTGMRHDSLWPLSHRFDHSHGQSAQTIADTATNVERAQIQRVDELNACHKLLAEAKGEALRLTIQAGNPAREYARRTREEMNELEGISQSGLSNVATLVGSQASSILSASEGSQQNETTRTWQGWQRQTTASTFGRSRASSHISAHWRDDEPVNTKVAPHVMPMDIEGTVQVSDTSSKRGSSRTMGRFDR